MTLFTALNSPAPVGHLRPLPSAPLTHPCPHLIDPPHTHTPTPAAQDLHHPPDLLIAADDGVEPRGVGGQVNTIPESEEGGGGIPEPFKVWGGDDQSVATIPPEGVWTMEQV